jgi:hypothetical protein
MNVVADMLTSIIFIIIWYTRILLLTYSI